MLRSRTLLHALLSGLLLLGLGAVLASAPLGAQQEPGTADPAAAADADPPAPDEVAALLAAGREALARGDRDQAATAFQQAGERALQEGRAATARLAYQQVLDLAQALDHAQLRAFARARLGQLLHHERELQGARELLQLAVGDAVVLQHGPLEMLARSELATVELALGDAEAADRHLEQALHVARSLGDGSNEVLLLARRGEIAWRRGAREQAEEAHAASLDLARRLQQPAPLAGALLESARFHIATFRFRAARAELEEALALGPPPRLALQLTGYLGDIALQSGDDLTALELYSDILATARQLGDAGLETAALGNLGLVHQRLGDYALADEMLEHALERAHDPADRVELLHNLAMTRITAGAPEEAGKPLEDALVLARQTAQGALEATVLSGLVVLRHVQGDHEQALALAGQQLALARTLRRSDIEAVALDNMAEQNLRLGRVAQARDLADEALALIRQLQDARLLQIALLTMVEVAHVQGDLDAMEATVREAEACFERFDTARLQPEQLSLLRAQDAYSLWGAWGQELVALALSSAAPGSPAARAALEEGFRRAGLWKGRALLHGMVEHRGGARTAASMALRAERQEALRERDHVLGELSAAQQAGAPQERIAALRARAGLLAERAGALLVQLREAAPAEALLEVPTGIRPAQLAGVLADGQVLIEYVDGKQRLYAYVLQGQRLTFHDLGARAVLDEQLAAFLGSLSTPGSLSPPAEVARLGRPLHQALLAPLLEHAPPGAPLLVVPSASLATLPVEALVAAAPPAPATFAELTFVLDQHQVAYAPSTPVLALLARVGPRSAPGPTLILADPVYPSERPDLLAARAPRPAASLERLPGTRHEALAIASALLGAGAEGHPELAALEATRSLAIEQERFSLHMGEEARPERLRGDLRRYGVIHCASHGWVDPDDPRRSGLVLSPDADGDGLLGVADILELDLDADLAVLSACETGRGAIRRGEGVQSLARAFLYAGARSVIASLWQVDDHETELLMRDFYGSFAGEAIPSAPALHQARLALRRDSGQRGAWRGLGRGKRLQQSGGHQPGDPLGGHPYFWAPFIFIGLPR